MDSLKLKTEVQLYSVYVSDTFGFLCLIADNNILE